MPEPVYTIMVEKTTTVRELYGYPLSDLYAPAGFEFTGEFRPSREVGEPYFSIGMCKAYASAADVKLGRHPRLILRELPKRRRWIIEEIGGPRRPVKVGEIGVTTEPFKACRGEKVRFWYPDTTESFNDYTPCTIREETI